MKHEHKDESVAANTLPGSVFIRVIRGLPSCSEPIPLIQAGSSRPTKLKLELSPP